MNKLKSTAGSFLNNQYNKAMYSAVTGYALDFIFQLLFDMGRPVSPELQNKALILAMGLVALLVPNKNPNNEGDSNMSNSVKTKLPIVLLFVLGFGILAGCARQIGDDNVPRVATFLQGSMEFVAQKGLGLLDKYAPEQVQPTIDDLNEVLDSIARYEDGDASTTDISDSIATLLDRLNVRLQFIEAPENAELVLDVITTGGNLAALFFDSVKLEPEVGIYVQAIGAGIRSGVFKYDQSKRPPLAFFVYPLPYLDPTTLMYSGSTI